MLVSRLLSSTRVTCRFIPCLFRLNPRSTFQFLWKTAVGERPQSNMVQEAYFHVFSWNSHCAFEDPGQDGSGMCSRALGGPKTHETVFNRDAVHLMHSLSYLCFGLPAHRDHTGHRNAHWPSLVPLLLKQTLDEFQKAWWWQKPATLAQGGHRIIAVHTLKQPGNASYPSANSKYVTLVNAVRSVMVLKQNHLHTTGRGSCRGQKNVLQFRITISSGRR